MKALDNIRVIAFEHMLAAPYCTMMLADMGAEVIKIEPKGRGEQARQNPPFVSDSDGNKHSGYFLSLNRNKKSVAMNIKHPKGREIFLKLVEVADVLVDNYRPGSLRALGLDYEVLKQVNPRIIYATITGFGYSEVCPTPYSDRPAFDIVAQAMGGLMSITGPEGGPPTRVGASLGDILAGMFAAYGIMVALHARERTGLGQWVDVSMMDSVMAVVENAIVRYSITGQVPGPIGNRHPVIAPFDSFEVQDGHVVIACGNDRSWQSLCKAMGREDLASDPRFVANPQRVERQAELKQIVSSWASRFTKAELVQLLLEHGCPAAPVSTIDEVVNSPHAESRQMVVPIPNDALSHVRIAGVPIKLSATPGGVETAPPVLGEHTLEVLTSVLKFTPEEVASLQDSGVV